MVAKTTYLVLKEVYDHFRLWAISPHTIEFSSELDLVPILGNRENDDEYFGLLRVIKRTNLNREKTDDRSPGRVGTGGDWLYYDLFARREISELKQKLSAARQRPPIAERHPVGWF